MCAKGVGVLYSDAALRVPELWPVGLCLSEQARTHCARDPAY